MPHVDVLQRSSRTSSFDTNSNEGGDSNAGDSTNSSSLANNWQQVGLIC
jgi:hypothetical protein